jgi:hypothetical protein
VVLTVLTAFVIAIWVPGRPDDKLRLALSYGVLILIFLFGFLVLAAIASGKIDISQLLAEKDQSGASMSRFQLLIFTFVVALSFFLVLICDCKRLPDVPANVLALLGISAATYGVGKGIQASASSKPKSGGTETTTPTNVSGD